MKYKINRHCNHKTTNQHGAAHFSFNRRNWSLNPVSLTRRQQQAAPYTSCHLSSFFCLRPLALSLVWACIRSCELCISCSIGKVTLSQLTLKVPSPAGIREQRVLAPLGHVAMVIAVVHSLRGVVSSQVVRRWVLGGTGVAPLAQGLLSAIWAVDVVADHPWLACLGHSHVEDPGVVLRAARGRANLMCTGL